MTPGIESLRDLSGTWWVAHTKARFEKVFAWDMLSHGIGYFLPMREKVIFSGGRTAAERGGRSVPTVRDWVAESITLKRGLTGAKPEGFCFWLFDLLGMQPGDVLEDLFPGTGGVSRAWDLWCARRNSGLFKEAR